MNTIKIRFDSGKVVEKPVGTRVGSLADEAQSQIPGLPIIGALVNNNVSSLSYPVAINCSVRFLTASDSNGWRIYRNSLTFLLAKAVRDVFPEADFSVAHSFGVGIYCNFHDGDAGGGITKEQVKSIEKHMQELVQKDVRIERRKISYADAVEQFSATGQTDKLNLLKFRNPPHVVIHWCDGFTDLAHGPLVPSTGVLKTFKLIHYKPGFVLHLPDREKPTCIGPFEDQPHLFNIFQEHKDWGRILGVTTAGRLNEITASGEINNFILTAEALHEKKLSKIAEKVSNCASRIRLVLIAGPSSAGKTTFAKRLTTHLKVNGLSPVTISTDDYFVAPEQTPKDEDGKLDYEHIDAVDVELFNRDLLHLVNGETIDIPRFNFEAKKREYDGRTLKVESDQIVIVEGIHGLNPRLTHMVPADRKFKIYISALTQLNVDSNNRISTTDNRLMRRMVRDRKFRGHSPLDTIRQWPSVRRGEKRWIFPFQREADATFNSALDYELAVLKPFVEPLLMEIKPSNPEYAEARRLSEFLLNFLPASDRHVPQVSILREYIGGSSLKY